LAQALRATVQGGWVGTATELLDLLGPATGITNSKGLSEALAQLAPMLRTVGLDVTQERGRTAHYQDQEAVTHMTHDSETLRHVRHPTVEADRSEQRRGESRLHFQQ
jgi:hypothetical protein